MRQQNFDRSRVLLDRKLKDIQLSKRAYPGGWSSPTHAHDNARFVFVLTGSFNEKYGRRERICRPFALVFRPPNEEHSEMYHNNGVICISVDISSEWINKLKQHQVRLDEPKELRGPNLTSLIVKLNEELYSSDDVSELAIETLLIESAIGIHRESEERSPIKNFAWIKRAEEYIRENSSSKLSLSAIASAVSIHPVHLARTFRSKHNCTIAEYIRQMRIESARIYLASTTLSLARIACEIGFADQSHFSRTFRRVTRMTPAEYRKNFRSFR